MSQTVKKALPEKTKNEKLQRIYKQRYLYLMMLPAVICVLLFCYAPLGGLYMAFVDFKPALGDFWGRLFSSEFVGLCQAKTTQHR